MKNLGDAASSFVLLENGGSVAEIRFRFPSIFRRRVSLPRGQVQSLARGAFVGNDMIDFVFFLGIN